ncbi:riboflavin kinase [Apostasia shenzhenica]|uniref:Riboflavin kinase n=1 Tax=Apostasia shenzhenica TaxID=1088818 RepID=A0A2I0APM7_9ASPA|nr:riboflavin kinase [Apostasia shenzhenica]
MRLRYILEERATSGTLKEFLAKNGKVLDPEKEVNRLGKMHKENSKAIVEDYHLAMTPEEFSQAIMPMYQQRWPLAKPLPGVNRLIKHLHKHGIPLGLASNSIKKYIATKISHQHGWKEMFSVIVGGDEVSHAKPSPDIFLEAASRLGVDASNCLVIEDSPVGVRAAKDAGAKVVAVPSLQNQAERYSIADRVLHSLLEFQPEIWGLPPFEDWTQSALLIEPLCSRGFIVDGDISNCCMLESDNGSSDSLPDQVVGVFFGWVKLKTKGTFKMVAAVGWDCSWGTPKRVIKPFFFGINKSGPPKEAFNLAFVGYIRNFLDEENILESSILSQEDKSIAWAALDLPEFSKDADSYDDLFSNDME